ncbi:MAG: radical SAM/SPASM domain protein, ACGX system [Clostridia bacterium]|nr:radical SAM/SPASM domain protein, ACGX system [Clostridia bacterium]
MSAEREAARNPLRENEEGLFGVQWHITDSCDQRCRHCYIFAEDNKKPLVSMDFAQMQEVIQSVEDFLGRMDMRPNWHITGGDPLLCPDFWKLAELMKEKKQPYLLLGNPFHLTQEICRRLKDTGCYAYQVSVDGMEKTHDWFRKPGSFRKTMEVFPLLRAAGIQSVVSMTVSERNYRELPDVMDAVEEAGADHFGFARYVPTSDEKANAIPPLEYRALLETYFQKRQMAKICGSRTNFTLKDHLLALYLYEEGRFHPPAYCHRPGDHMPAGCHCANATMAISPDGTVMACRRMESSALGNIFTDDLMEMWTEAKARYRQYDRFADCARCKLEPWCRGCPAISAAVSGDYYGRDPQCWRVVEE